MSHFLLMQFTTSCYLPYDGVLIDILQICIAGRWDNDNKLRHYCLSLDMAVCFRLTMAPYLL